jgi:hypothetical protein
MNIDACIEKGIRNNMFEIKCFANYLSENYYKSLLKFFNSNNLENTFDCCLKYVINELRKELRTKRNQVVSYSQTLTRNIEEETEFFVEIFVKDYIIKQKRLFKC